jgi:hypothetical protein
MTLNKLLQKVVMLDMDTVDMDMVMDTHMVSDMLDLHMDSVDMDMDSAMDMEVLDLVAMEHMDMVSVIMVVFTIRLTLIES